MNEEERNFLHAMANPLASAIMVLDTVIDDDVDENLRHRLQSVQESLERIKILLQDRQAILMLK